MKQKVNGNLSGIRDSVIEALETFYQYEAESFLPRELMQALAKFTAILNREIAIYLTRDGDVLDVSVGSDHDVSLQDLRLRRSTTRLSCIRCIHTHPNGDGRLSDVDLSALRSYRYDAMVAIGCKNGEPTFVQSAFLGANQSILMDEPQRWYRLPEGAWEAQVEESDRIVGYEADKVDSKTEKCVLMGIENEESLEELKRLAETAGAEVIGMFLQKRERPDGALFIGKGRAEQLALEMQALEADMCIFDEELTGIQMRNLEDTLHAKVIDRTTLILDIFAQRASSAEGKLQVELAMLQYQSTRLTGQGVMLSRLAGGIGTRGPGESKLEMNRRRIRDRITELKRRLDALDKQRGIRRKSREKNEIPVVALVGYTNAGKSTLLNTLTGADVYVQDQLFATLDAVSRRTETDAHTPYLLVDTVGFIRKLPHTLVSAFRSTLEEATLADILLIVSDGASDQMLHQHETVEEVLSELGATEQKRIEVINKCDLPAVHRDAFPEAVCVSAHTGEGLDELRKAIAKALEETFAPVTFVIPFSDYGRAAVLRKLSQVVSEEYTDVGTEMTVLISAGDRDRLISQWGADCIRKAAE